MSAPSIFTNDLFDEVLRRMSEDARSLRSVCQDEDMPSRNAFLSWIRGEDEASLALRTKYAHAREQLVDSWLEDTVEISDTPQIGEETITKPDGSVEVRSGDMLGHRKLRVETRRWMAEKLLPKKYGPSTLLKHADADGAVLPPPPPPMQIVVVRAVEGRVADVPRLGKREDEG